jgi:hypothetical protein
MSLIVEWNASVNMFYLLKNLLLLIMVIFKLKCNNLFFNKDMILSTSYVCLHAFSLCRESLDPDYKRRTLISEVILSQTPATDVSSEVWERRSWEKWSVPSSWLWMKKRLEARRSGAALSLISGQGTEVGCGPLLDFWSNHGDGSRAC